MTPYAPWALRTHDVLWGVAVAMLSVGMFIVTPGLAVLRKAGLIGMDWFWIFLPAIACVAAVFLHGFYELVRGLREELRP
jgi:putative effector of murein hydrolase LrgA (UPF0299 family)